MKRCVLILVAMTLTGLIVSVAGAHTYDPDTERCMVVIDLDEAELEWGDTMKISDCYHNVTYEIEVVDFHILGVEPVLADGDDPCSGRECIVTPETSSVNLKVYRDIYGTDELILNAPFQANESILEGGLFTCASGTTWDNTGYVWNYEHEFYMAVSEITCDFAGEDCFCTDPENEKAKVKCFTVAPPDFEFDVKTILPGDEYEDMEVFRSNSEFIAEIKLKNTGSNAYHTRAWFAARPAEMIDGKYPPDCTIERIYKGKHDDEDKFKEDTKLPMNLRTLDEEDWFYTDKDWFNADDEVLYTVYFKTPTIPKMTEYRIEVNLTCEDFKERTLYFPRDTDSKKSRWFFDNFEECPHNLTYNETKVEILPALEVKKAIGTEDYAIIPEEAAEPYTSGTTYVIYEDYEPYVFLTVKNWGEYAISAIQLSDSPNGTWHKPATTDFNKWKCALSADVLKIPEMENDRWNWGFSLEPGEVMMCAYPVSLLKPGTYKLGSAAVNWTENGFNYSVDSCEQSVEVHGPYIEVMKRVEPASVTQNGTANIVVSVKNTGDRPTSITIFDQIPEESILVTAPTGVRGIIVDEENGTFSLRRVLKANAGETLRYTINPNRTVMLPPVVVKFADLTQYGAISISDMPLLTVEGTEPIGVVAEKIQSELKKTAAAPEETVETPEPVATPVRKEPGFAGLLAVIACLAAVLIERRRRK